MNYFCLPKEVGSSCHFLCITSRVLRCAAFTANTSTYSRSVAMFLYHFPSPALCRVYSLYLHLQWFSLFVLRSRRACYDTRPRLKRSHSKHRPALSPLELRTILIRTPSELYSGITCTVLLHTPC